MNRKGQIEFDDLNWAGIIFAVVAFGIGMIVSKSMNAGVLMRVISGVICAFVAYLVGGKIAES